MAPLYHYVHHGRTPEEKAASAAKAKAQLDDLAANTDEIWVRLFGDMAFSGMERDTADLQIACRDARAPRASSPDWSE